MECLFSDAPVPQALVGAVASAHRRRAGAAGHFSRLPMPWLVLTVARGAGGQWQDETGRWHTHPRVALRGLFDRPSRAIEPASAIVDYSTAMIEPWACEGLFGVPARALRSQVVDLTELDAALARRLCDTADAAQPERALLDILAGRWAGADAVDPLLRRASMCMQAQGGAARIGRIELCSERWLRERFVQGFGLPPKRYARLLRFALALRSLHAQPWAMPFADWHSHAGVADYHDASHQAREFRALADCSPADYRRAKLSGHRAVFTLPGLPALG